VTSQSFQLDGSVAVVTGAAGGIGSAIAVGLATFGADVACLDLAGERLDAVVESVERTGRRGIAVPVNVSSADDLDRAVVRTEEVLGPLRLAVNTAGIHSAAAAEEMAPESWQRVLDINLTGLFFSCQAEGRAMLRGGRGSILNIGSISGRIANRGIHQAHYNATKAAVAHLSRTLALEWADRGIRVNTLSPGYVRTPMARSVRTTRKASDFLDDIPMRRLAEPSEMVGPAVFLLGGTASYCTGAELVVDGGATCW
jgi:NAD(P)-dependent dehydrogenase (short-subunit alcohol dehydrogenase family)